MKELKKREHIRIPNYDYSENGYYFVTICSNARENIFGEYRIPVGAGLVSDRNNDNYGDKYFELSTVGGTIESQWLDIPHQYDNVELDEYIIMPNHIHGIIVINKTKKRADSPLRQGFVAPGIGPPLPCPPLFVHLNRDRRWTISNTLNAITWILAAKYGNARFTIISFVTNVH
jgi:REP element-mobilizing transposase RayT